MSTGLADADNIDLLAQLTPPLLALRRSRDAVRAATQGSFDALFEAPPLDGLSTRDRHLAALRVAVLQGDEPLAALHRHRAREQGADAGQLTSIELRPAPAQAQAHAGADLLSALLAFVDRLTLHPASAAPEHLEALSQRGVPVPAIVTLAQLVAFVNYEVRLLAGLRALAAAGSGQGPAPDHDALLAGRNTLHPQAPGRGRFTAEVLAWRAWLPTVAPDEATPEQLAVLDESHASARSSPYYLTLVHNPEVLRQRSRLFNAIMAGPGGLPRAERELATVAVSRINGCTYCASVHARLFSQLTHDTAVVERLFAEGVNTPLSPRRRLLVDLAVDLTANPPAVDPARIAALRGAGLGDGEILDAIHAAAIFAWANPLMQTLGEPTGPGQD
jgi:uncharacterized peroxidase-related enzyme